MTTGLPGIRLLLEVLSRIFNLHLALMPSISLFRHSSVDTQIFKHSRNQLQPRFPVCFFSIAFEFSHSIRLLFLNFPSASFANNRHPVLCSCMWTLKDLWKPFQLYLCPHEALILIDRPHFFVIARNPPSIATLFFLSRVGDYHIPAAINGSRATPSFLMSEPF